MSTDPALDRSSAVVPTRGVPSRRTRGIAPDQYPDLMAMTAATLAEDLLAAPKSRWVRLVAHWLADGDVSAGPVPLTDVPVIDALVAAATAQLARTRGEAVPDWTREESRILEAFWQPAGPQFYAWSLAHAAEEFFLRGIVIEQDSLVAV